MSFSEKLKKLCRTSLFISALMMLVNGVYNCLRDGLFGRFMTMYSREDKMLRKGKIGRLFSKRGTASSWFRTIRLHLAVFFEKSVIIQKLSASASYLLGCSVRFYGIFLLTFGIYTVLIHFIKQFAALNISSDPIALLIGVLSVIIAVPMIGSRQAVSAQLRKGLIPHAVLLDVFGIPEERLDIPRAAKGGKYNIAVIGGMLMGILTFLIPPHYILLTIVATIAVGIVLSYPEIGVLVTLAGMPLLTPMQDSVQVLDFVLGLTAVAYLGKLIRGKRIIRFSLIDTLVLLFGIVLLFGGMASVGGNMSMRESLYTLSLLLMYFMVVNLIRTPALLHRAVIAVVGSATVTALLGVFQYIGGEGSVDRLDLNMFPSILGRVSVMFESPNMLAAYLMMILPLCAAVFVTAQSAKSRLVAGGCGLAMLFALIFTWSRSAWLSAFVALMFFFLVYSRKTFCWLFFGGLTVPIWWAFLPDQFLSRLTSIGNLADSSTYQRIFTWRGSVRMISDHLLGGVGYGTEAFTRVYPQYSFRGLEQMTSANSLYLSLLAAVGLLGMLVFLIMLVVYAQQCFEYIGNASESYSRTLVAAGLAGIVGALVMGIGTDIWHDKTVFLTFFTMMALTGAHVRAGNLIRSRNEDVSTMNVTSAYVDLRFEN